MHLLRTMMAALVLLTTSCAAPYRKRPAADECSGSGYSETKEADGRYVVTYVGPTRQIRGVSAAAKRRALELCPSGYSAVQNKGSGSFLCPSKNEYGMRAVPAAVLTVTCKNGG
jgi:hypothetical protein